MICTIFPIEGVSSATEWIVFVATNIERETNENTQAEAVRIVSRADKNKLAMLISNM